MNIGRDRTPHRPREKFNHLTQDIMKKKIKMAAGVILFLAGFVCSAGQRPDGGPAPLWTLCSALVMIVGGNMYSRNIKDEGDEV